MDKKLFDEVEKNIDIVQENGKLGYDMIINTYFSDEEQNKKHPKFNLKKIMISLTSFVLIAVLTVVLILNLTAPVYLTDNYVSAHATQTDFEKYSKSAEINFSNLSSVTDGYTLLCWKDSESGDTLKYTIDFTESIQNLWGTIAISTNKHFQLSPYTEQAEYSTTDISGATISYTYNLDYIDYLATGTAYFELDGQKVLLNYSRKISSNFTPTETDFWAFFNSVIEF